MDRLPDRRRRRARFRRLCCQPHGRRLRAGGDRRTDVPADRQTHSSLARAARHLGFRPDQVRVIATDEQFRIRIDDLAAAIDADTTAGRIPFLVNGNAGTTSTGAIDDLAAIAGVCRQRGVWFHVDGAYGAFAVLSDRGRTALAGLDLADSVTLDPHKWLAMPFEIGCLLVRDGSMLERAFELHPEYLREFAHERGVNFADRGLQLTRASRAIKVWLAIQTFGVDAFRAAIDRTIDLTLEAQCRIEADNRLELVTPASLGVLTFRRRGESGESNDAIDRRNEQIVASLAAAGDVVVTSTLIRGRYAIRLCVLNHSTGAEDVAYALERVATAEIEAAADLPTELDRAQMQAAVALDWLATPAIAPNHLRRISIFASVTDDEAEQLLATGRREAYATDEPVTERWGLSRTFYIVQSGRLAVLIDDRQVTALGPGDHFGEISAID